MHGAAQTQLPISDVAMFRALVRQSPDSGLPWVQLAQALLEAGDNIGALEAADTARRVAPDLALGWLLRGLACQALGRLPEATTALTQAARLAPRRPAILIALSSVLAAQDHLLAAETCLRFALEVAPDSVAALANLGGILARQNRLEPAEAACRAALALEPDLVVAHVNLAAILETTNQAEATLHRQAAYTRQQIFPATHAAQRTALVLTGAAGGNIPLKHLLPATGWAQHRWVASYAPPGQEQALPAHDLIFNAMGDADLAPDLSAHVARLLAQTAAKVVNPPGIVARTGRAQLPGLLAGIPGLVVPRICRLAGPASGWADQLAGAGLELPVILRPIGSHGGQGLHLVETPADLCQSALESAFATQFVAYRNADGWHRKYRFIFIDRVPFAYHLAIGAGWMLHHHAACMQHDPARRAEEAAFLANPATAIGAGGMAALAEIGTRLDLDYGGIDFSVLPDGRLLVFEANATMLVHPEDDAIFAYRNPAVQRILDAFAAWLEGVTARMAQPSTGPAASSGAETISAAVPENPTK